MASKWVLTSLKGPVNCQSHCKKVHATQETYLNFESKENISISMQRVINASLLFPHII